MQRGSRSKSLNRRKAKNSEAIPVSQDNGMAWKAEKACKLSVKASGKQGKLNQNLINNSDERGQGSTPDWHDPQMSQVFNKRVGEKWLEKTMASNYMRIQG